MISGQFAHALCQCDRYTRAAIMHVLDSIEQRVRLSHRSDTRYRIGDGDNDDYQMNLEFWLKPNLGEWTKAHDALATAGYTMQVVYDPALVVIDHVVISW